MTFSDVEGPKVATRGGDRHLTEILEALEASQASGLTNPILALESLSGQVSRNSLVVACSDLLDSGKDVMQPLAALRTRGADVALRRILHPDEVHFPFDGVVRFLDMEGDRAAQVDAEAVKAAYLEEIGA